MSTYYTWTRGEAKPLGRHFSTTEFTCRCSHSDCQEQRVSVELIDKLDKLRDFIEMPIVVTSGFRCHKRQLELAASGHETAIGTSQHELGNAADVCCTDMDKLKYNVGRFFMAIGVAHRFIHLDTRSDRMRSWTYRD